MGILAQVDAGRYRAMSEEQITREGWVLTGSSSTGVRVNADAVYQLSTAQACIRLLSDTVAYLPLDLFKYIDTVGSRDKARENSLYSVLHDQPNTIQTSADWVGGMVLQLVLRGNAYSRIIPGPRGPVDQLIPLHPDRVYPERLGDDFGPGRMVYHYITKGGQRKTFYQEEILHVRGFSDDGIVGLAQLNIGRNVFGTAIATETYGANMFKNGAQLGGILRKKSGGTLTATAKQNLQNDLKRFTGSGNAFKTLVLEEDLEWTQIGMRARDAEFLASRKFSVTEICRIFRVPPHMVADLDRSTNNNIEEQGIEFVVYTLGPWLKRIEQAIRRDLILDKERYFAEFNVDALLRGDIASRYTAYGTGIEKGFLTRNEVRRKENLNDIEGLDTPLRPLNMGNGAQPPSEEASTYPRMEMFVRAAADRLANKELTAVRKAVGSKSGDELTSWLDQFYLGFAADISSGLIIDYATAEEFAMAAKSTLMRVENKSVVLDGWEKTRPSALTELGLLKGEPLHA